MASIAMRYARAGYKAILESQEKIVSAAEAEIGGSLIEQREDKSVGTLCVCRGPPIRVLLIRQRTHTGEHWGLPKGHPDPGENDVDTALRELAEETGVQLSHDDIAPCGWEEIRYSYVGKIWSGDWKGHEKYPDERYRTCVFHKLVKFALVCAPQPPPQLVLQAEEVAGAEWLGVEEAAARMTYDEERKAMLELLRRLG